MIKRFCEGQNEKCAVVDMVSKSMLIFLFVESALARRVQVLYLFLFLLNGTHVVLAAGRLMCVCVLFV